MWFLKKRKKKYIKIIEGKLREKGFVVEKEPKLVEKWRPDVIACDKSTGKHLLLEIKDGFAITDTIIQTHRLGELAKEKLGAPITSVVVVPQATEDAKEMAKKFKVTLAEGDEEEVEKKIDDLLLSPRGQRRLRQEP